MKKVLMVLEKILQITLIVLLIINIISVFSIKILKNDYPKIFGFSNFAVLTGSMEPTINVGDEVIVKITKDVKTNDIITYRENNSFVTHRLIRIEKNQLITKGDFNNAEDDPIDKDRVVGKVVLIIPFLGRIKYIITNMYFIIVLLIVCFIIGFILSEDNSKE